MTENDHECGLTLATFNISNCFIIFYAAKIFSLKKLSPCTK